MSKKYLTIETHGWSGDFYRCDEGGAFRADNLIIATQIAFNNWLKQFNNLYRECSLTNLTEGQFTVSIYDSSLRGTTQTETHIVSYYGPADMFTIEHIFQKSMEHSWFSELYTKMTEMLAKGDDRVKLSKSTGLVYFNICFPRYDKNGTMWCREHNYLSDDQELANQQWEYICATEEERHEIAKRNFSKMK